MRVLYFAFILFVFVPVILNPAAHAADEYTCPMHPHIIGEKGESCPICGMTLVPKIATPPKNEGTHSEHDMDQTSKLSFRIDPSFVHVLGIKTSEAALHDFGKHIRAFGKIEPSTRLEYALDVRAKGWVVDLPVDAVGDTVKKGDLLFTYYSPDLMTAQSDFLIGSRIGSGEERLRLYGMSDQAISELKKERKILEKTPFYAPADGIVTVLNARKGAYMGEGSEVLSIQDLSNVWVTVDVPLRDAQFLSIGTTATVKVPETGKSYKTVIDFIHPVSDPTSRTVKVRMILNNSDNSLKPETYVDVVFNADVQSRLAVPEEAVLYDSTGAYVLENVADGMFSPHRVTTGITAKGLTEIKSGISVGQMIVTSGQFMLDAESNLRGGMSNMEQTTENQGATHHHGH